MKKINIQINSETKININSLKKRSETYDDVIQRMYLETISNIQARVFFDTQDSNDIEDILRARKITP